MSTLKILAFLLLGFIVHVNALRCFSYSNYAVIDCPPDANDVCASAYCSVIPDPEGPFAEGEDWISECISGFDKASACKALDNKYCNTTERPYVEMHSCRICSSDECKHGDEPEWRKTTPNHPDEPIPTTQNPPELSKSTTAGPDPMTVKNKPEITTTEANNAIHHFTIPLFSVFIVIWLAIVDDFVALII